LKATQVSAKLRLDPICEGVTQAMSAMIETAKTKKSLLTRGPEGRDDNPLTLILGAVSIQVAETDIHHEHGLEANRILKA